MAQQPPTSTPWQHFTAWVSNLWQNAPRPGRRTVGIGAAVLLVLLVIGGIVAGVLLTRGGDGDGFPEEVATQDMGELVLDSVLITQEGEQHEVAPGLFRDEVEDLSLEPGEAGVVLHFTGEDSEPATGAIIYTNQEGDESVVELDGEGNALFSVNLTLGDEGNARLNTFTLRVGDDEREVSLQVVKPTDNGLTGGDMVNTPTELGVEPEPDQPRTIVDLEVSPLFVEAFAEFCGFTPDQVKRVSLEPNDRQRFQVGWDGANFVQSRNTIPKGQPIWVLISNEGDKCRINPPCGNPSVPQGKLPLVPPGKEVPPSTPTPPSVSTPTPPGKTPPGKTPTATPPRQDTPTPTNTPPTPPTSTPVPPKCLVTILGPHRVNNTSTHANMQSSIQWDQPPNFSATINWFLDGTFIGGGPSVNFMATLNVDHVLSVQVLSGGLVICTDAASFAEGSIPPGEDPPGSDPIPTDTPIPAPEPTTDPDDGFDGPQ